MLEKELCELLDAISREKGDPMSPIEELVLLGVYPELRELKHSTARAEIEYDEDSDEYVEEEENYNEVDEEYEFDEDDENFSLLNFILRRNNDRKKYFA